MALKPYLLEVQSFAGDAMFTQTYIIREASEQMVKYHYHRTQKHGMYTDTPNGSKHMLESFDLGVMCDIGEIVELDAEEWKSMDGYIPKWPKV